VGAAFERVTVQAAVALAPRLAGVHCKDETRTAACRETVADTAELFRDPVMVTVWLAVTLPVLTPKVVDVAFAGMVAEAGTVKLAAVLAESVTVVPPATAAPEMVTWQVAEADEPKELGVQLSAVTVRGGEVKPAVPPVAERGRAFPAREALTGLLTPIATVVSPGARANETVATTPLAMVSLVDPVAKQMYAPALPLQVSDLLAVVRAGPGATEMFEIAAVG